MQFILRGITTALLVTVLTLFAGIAWGVMGLGSLSISTLLDIGLLLSCFIGGYRTAKESGEWLTGGIVGAGYVTVGTLLLALFLPIRGLGFIQVLAEGAIIGLVAGAVGVGGGKGTGTSAWSSKRPQFTPSYPGYETNNSLGSKFNWDQEEELKEWKEAPISNWIESSEGDLKGTHGVRRDSEKSPDVQWSWDGDEEKHKGWKDAPITKGIESCEKSQEVQWPWNRDKKELFDSGPRQLEPLVVWEPDPVRTDVLGRNRASLSNVSENVGRGTRPWWEQ